MYKVLLSDEAEKDLHKIVYYINEQLQNPISAVKTISKIEKTLNKRLEVFPYSYPVHSYLESFGIEYRRTIIDNFTAFYIVDDVAEVVTITHILYNKRDVSKLIK